MTATGGFPSNCSTNTYILQDFSEIAYIICTVAIPPSSNPGVPAPSPESNFARLKHTESQFRHASILAVIDPDTLQLFTFYKKVDVLKDRGGLLQKFGVILRSNSCTIAYKAAARIPDLFKPEQAKLYRLFVSAILASIKVVPSEDSRQTIRLGQRYHAIEDQDHDDAERSSTWSLIRTDLQIIPTGHVTLTVVFHQEFTLVPLSGESSLLPKAALVVLAPGGQIAVYRIEAEETANPESSANTVRLTDRRREIWKARISAWFKTNGHAESISDSTTWIELMLPAYEHRVNKDADRSSPRSSVDPQPKFALKQILWPSHMCFARALDASPKPAEIGADEDPLQFVLDWIQSEDEREVEMQRQTSENDQDGDASLFADEGSFDNLETYQPFGPPVFPSSQTVYPTPPDVTMTHATPGMSSVDGLVATPATLSRVPADSRQGHQDIEMATLDAGRAPGVGSGLYDEDLFEEMPDGRFDQDDTGVEPNWDFFDMPDMDIDRPEHQVDDGSNDATSTSLQGTAHPTAQSNNVVPGMPSGEAFEAPVDRTAVSLADQHQDGNTEPRPEDQEQHYAGSLAHVDPIATATTSAEPTARRRRSSVYGVIQPDQLNISYDAKYSQSGEFWFDSTVKRNSQHLSTRGGSQPRTPSSSSTSVGSWSSANDGPGRETNNQSAVKSNNLRQWHDYRPVSVAEEKKDDDFHAAKLHAEINSTLELLQPKINGQPLEDLFAKRKNVPGKGTMPVDTRLMLAQMFVEQYTQASLLHAAQLSEAEPGSPRSSANVSVDLSQLNCNADYATLSQLTDITPLLPGRQSTGRILRLSDNHVMVKRSDRPLIASPTIIPFWDTLALQPIACRKDVTAFCLYPAGSGYLDGSSHFLSRIADAYESCGLGNHTSGQIPGSATGGVLAMASDTKVVARKLVEAVTITTETTETIVVYVICKFTDARHYILSCQYFIQVFSSFKTAILSHQKAPELVLQIVPGSLLISSETLVVPAQSKFNALAFEVYSRIPPEANALPGINDFPLTLFDTSDSVKFHLDSHTTSPTSKNGNVLHLAYSYSDDQRWLIATWTDVFGEKALTMTYHLRVRSEAKGLPLEEVIKELWDVSHDLMRKLRSKWRLVVARNGFYDASEINSWMHLANGEAKSKTCEICLVSINLRPGLRLVPPDTPSKAGLPASTSQQASYGTPVSTPQAASITTPENLVPATPTPGGTSVLNAPTPPEYSFDTSIDGDLVLTHPVEDSWAAILPFGCNQSQSIFDVRPALLSGYLVKRLGLKDEDGTAMIGVHLIHAPSTAVGPQPGQREELLGDIIDQFRGLSTLAAARGCIDQTRNVLPWHIHTSVAASDVLGTLI